MKIYILITFLKNYNLKNNIIKSIFYHNFIFKKYLNKLKKEKVNKLSLTLISKQYDLCNIDTDTDTDTR